MGSNFETSRHHLSTTTANYLLLASRNSRYWSEEQAGEEQQEMQMGHVIDDAIPSVFVPTAKEYPHCRISGLRACTTAAALYENLVFKFNCACA